MADDDDDADSDEARTLRPLRAEACTYRIAFGPRAGQEVLTLQGDMPRDADFKQTLCADIQGFSLHAAVRCGADDRQALEQQPLGDGLLQVFMDSTGMDWAVRVIPREIFETTPPDELPAFSQHDGDDDVLAWTSLDGTYEEISGLAKPVISSFAEYGGKSAGYQRRALPEEQVTQPPTP